MKKILAVLLAALFVLSACGCDKTASAGMEETAAPTAAEEFTAEPTTEPTAEPTPPITASPLPEDTPTLSPELTATPEVTEKPIDLTKFSTLYVTHSRVNVRAEAKADSAKLTTLAQNTEVKAYQKAGGWYYIQYASGKFGYMSADYLSEQPVPEATPVQTEMPEYKYNSNIDINDNVFLDALAFTGYKLDKHRQDGNMWVFILGKDKQGLGYLSGLGYDYGVSSGYETNAAGVPDIAKIKKNGGLVCASYVTYVYFNYLPNVAKIDVSALTKPENSRSAQSWRLAAEDWVAKGLSQKIGFSAKRNSNGTVVFHPKESIPIGSIVVFKVHGASDSAEARHVGIYAGYAGGYHWMTHVGNERGPEMITIERMGYSSTPEVPLEIITPPVSFDAPAGQKNE